MDSKKVLVPGAEDMTYEYVLISWRTFILVNRNGVHLLDRFYVGAPRKDDLTYENTYPTFEEAYEQAYRDALERSPWCQKADHDLVSKYNPRG